MAPAFTSAAEARLRALGCAGRFEAHLTVEAAGPERRAAFAATCAALGVKPVWIELARGEHPSQPMTSSHHAGSLDEVLAAVGALHARLVAAGFPVRRVKLEAEVGNTGIPHDGDAVPAGTYFEFHAKLAAPVAGDLAAQRALCVAAGAHLSRNAHDADGARFVTLRVYDAALEPAAARFAALREALVAAGHEVGPAKAEYTVHDDRVELDAGWLP